MKKGTKEFNDIYKLDLKVLVVDDNLLDRTVVKGALVNLGFRTIVEAEDGSLAHYKIQNAMQLNTAFDLIIADWQMPHLSGLQLLRWIRNEKTLRHTKLIILTASGDSLRVHEAIAEGVDDFIVKPIQLDAFQEKIFKVLGLQKQVAEGA